MHASHFQLQVVSLLTSTASAYDTRLKIDRQHSQKSFISLQLCRFAYVAHN